ncbi:MAG: hypothetical protein IJ752_00010 [Alphaproteobacteria bacterium]|nr:hypothetical protein [Alphaproteobacteria bacterium]
MKKTHSQTAWRLTTAVSLAVILTASYAQADTLPTDPWAVATQTQAPAAETQVQTGTTQATVVQVQQVGPVVYGSQPYQPTYAGGSDNIWNTKMPEFTGEMTTWGDSANAKYNAPEVNTHNILSITQHLRNMGYKIPDSFENKVKNAPAATKRRILNAMKEMASANDPFSKGTRFALKAFEKETGLSYENLVGNSLNLISSK